MQNNNIGEKGVEAMSDMLKINATLTKIIFDGNYISQEGVGHIVNAMDTNTSIITLSGFNNSSELKNIISSNVIKNIKQFEYVLQMLNQKTINSEEVNCSLLLTTLKQLQVQKDHFKLESDSLYKKASIFNQLSMLTNQIQESEIGKCDDMLVQLVGQIEQEQSIEYLDFLN